MEGVSETIRPSSKVAVPQLEPVRGAFVGEFRFQWVLAGQFPDAERTHGVCGPGWSRDVLFVARRRGVGSFRIRRCGRLLAAAGKQGDGASRKQDMAATTRQHRAQGKAQDVDSRDTFTCCK